MLLYFHTEKMTMVEKDEKTGMAIERVRDCESL